MEVMMKRLVKYAIIFVLVLCGILIAGSALLHLVNLDPLRDRIASMATKATGRRVEINGHLDINLFPHPEVVLNDVTFGNANWGSEPAMARVGHVDAAVNFLSLFSDTIIVRRVRLNDVSLLLERNAQQIGNWVMESTDLSARTEKVADQDPDAIDHLPLIVNYAECSNITVIVRAPETLDQVYRLKALSLQPDESDNLILQSSSELLDLPVTLNGEITSKETIAAFGAVNVALQASWLDAELNAQLSTSRLATLSDLKGTFTITAQDIQKGLDKAKIKAPFAGPLTAEAKVHRDDSVYMATAEIMVEGMTASVDASYKDKLMELSAALTPLKRAGELFDLQGLSDDPLKLKAKVTGSDTSKFIIKHFEANVGNNQLAGRGRVDMNDGSEISLSLTSTNLSTFFNKLPEIDMNAKAKVKYSAENISVPEFGISFKKSDLNGDLAIMRADKYNITANVSSKLLDLRFLSKSSKAEPVGKKSENKSQYVFKQIPLDLEALEGIESDVKLSVDELYFDKIMLKEAVIDTAVHDGHVDAKVKFTSVNGGKAAAKIDLKSQGKKAMIDAVVSLSDFRIKGLSTESISPEQVPPLSVSLDITSVGSSPRELAAVANGKILITQGAGKVNDAMLGMFSSDILDQLIGKLNPFAMNEEFSNWDCTVLSIDIVDGRAAFDTMFSQGEKVMIVGGGDIDLKTEKLNIEFNTKPRKGVGISVDMFVTPFIKVKGTLASPAIGLNKKGTLLTGGAAIATGGLSILAKGLFDRTTAQGDKCEKALENLGGHIHYSF